MLYIVNLTLLILLFVVFVSEVLKLASLAVQELTAQLDYFESCFFFFSRFLPGIPRVACILGRTSSLLRQDPSGVSIKCLSFQQIFFTLASQSSSISQPLVSSEDCSAQISLVTVPLLPHRPLPYIISTA